MDLISIMETFLGKQKVQNCEYMIGNNLLCFRTDHTLLYVLENIETEYNPLPINPAYHYPNDQIDVQLSKEMSYILHLFQNASKLSPLVYYDNVQEDPEFQRLMKLRSDQGLEYYRLYDNNHKQYFFPMYSGFLKINNGDKLDIGIHAYNDLYLLQRCILYKKKLRQSFTVYFLTLRM